MNKHYWLWCMLLISITSCEKNITIVSPKAAEVLVVEATIENGEYPIVLLSKSLDYFGKISAVELNNSFVSNATVTISNGILTHQLKEYIQPITPTYSIKFYTINPANIATAFKGVVNSNYSLTILAEGKTYTATTTIPKITRRIDSMYVADLPPGNDTVWKRIFIKAYDQPGLGDYIRYYTKQNSEQYLPGDPSVFDDAIIDGTQYQFELPRGKDRNNPSPDGQYSSYFKKGDTVTFKNSNIDKATYDFWRTMEYTYQSIGNPFASPIKVLSNINGASALGYFGGYASQYKTIIIPR